jgi:hypothetical protein
MKNKQEPTSSVDILVDTEVLPACSMVEVVLEGDTTSTRNIHANAGGTLRKASPTATATYFTKRFALFA